MIIDGNVHGTSNGKWFNSNVDASIENLLNSLKINQIDKALLIPIGDTLSNDEVWNIFLKYPDFILPGAYFNPGLFKESIQAIEAFEKAFSNTKFKVIKFHNRIGNYHPDDERFSKVLEYNNSLPEPIAIAICSLFVNPNWPSTVVPPQFIFELCNKYSKTDFIIMHGGGSWILQTAEMVRSLKNVFLDLSFTISRYKDSSLSLDVKWLCNNFDKRLIWGSDFPEIPVSVALNDFYDLSIGVHESKIDNILGKNLAELLKYEF